MYAVWFSFQVDASCLAIGLHEHKDRWFHLNPLLVNLCPVNWNEAYHRYSQNGTDSGSEKKTRTKMKKKETKKNTQKIRNKTKQPPENCKKCEILKLMKYGTYCLYRSNSNIKMKQQQNEPKKEEKNKQMQKKLKCKRMKRKLYVI